MSVNVVAITGRLGKSPEIKKTQSGISYCNFSVAVDRNYKSGDERITDWIPCKAWRNQADFLEKFFGRGDMIGITGTLEVNSWETEAAEKRSMAYVNVSQISFVGGKSGGNAQSDTGTASTDGFVPDAGSESELPF